MRSDRLLRVTFLALTSVLALWLCASFTAASLTPVPYSGIMMATPTNHPMDTPNATEIADGYLSVTAYPNSGPAPLSVVIVASYIGPYGTGTCGLGPWVNQYEFGDGTDYGIPAPGCAVPPRTPEPTPTGLARWTQDGVQHTYRQAGTYHVRVSGGTVNNHGIMAETTVVVSAPPPPPATSGGEIDPRTLALVLAGGGAGLFLLVALAFVIAAR